MSRHVLVIDDEQSVRDSIAGALRDEGFKVSSVANSASAFEVLDAETVDAVLLDVWMTDSKGERQQEGLDILGRIKIRFPDLMVIIMSGHGNIETAVKATKLGAFDFIEKPLSLEKLLVTIQNAFQMRDLSRENKSLRSRVAKSKILIGESPVMLALKQAIRRVASTNAWVLITGENGTGKELVANSIHSLSPRFNKPFIEVNCAAIPEELIESELFGHEKGSFTGATQLKRGKFDLANGGTLFLDEIGDMSLKTQAKILRILQEQRFERVGGAQTIEVDVRVIAATNKNLQEQIKQNLFREDLYYRLNVVPFHVPALRDRASDIPAIVQFFLKEFSSTSSGEVKKISSEALALFENYPWPGNVRELKNTIERLMIFTESPQIEVDQLLTLMPQLKQFQVIPLNLPSSGQSQEGISSFTDSLRDAKTEFEKEFILKKLKENDWNVSKTAQVLGIERSHLHKKMKSYGIETRATDL